MSEDTSYGITRRDALKLGAGTLAGAAASVAALQGAPLAALAAAPTDLNEATVVQLQALMAKKKLGSVDLVDFYLSRIRAIDQSGPTVNSVIEVNPDAREIAGQLDHERRTLGPAYLCVRVNLLKLLAIVDGTNIDLIVQPITQA